MNIADVCDVTAERVVLATMVANGDHAAKAWQASGCTVEMLTDTVVQRAVSAWLEAYAIRKTAGLLDATATLSQYERDRVMADLHLDVADCAPYLRSIRVHHEQREAMIAIQRHMWAAATARSPEDRLDALSAAKAVHVPRIDGQASKDKATLLKELFAEDVSGVEKLPPVSTSLRCLDKAMSGGFRANRLYVLSARPGGGKTSLALAMLVAACKEGKRVAFVSLEMEASELHRRLASYLSGVPLLGSRAATPSEAEALRKAYAQMSAWDYEIWDRPPRSYDEVVQWLCAQHETQPLGMVILDYLQLLPSTGAERDDLSIGQHTTRSKNLAKLLGIPFILIAQPNRAAEVRGDGRYRMSDLRGSGQIEQDADWIAFLWQPPQGASGYPEGYAEIDIAKHRHGPKVRFRLQWHGATYRYSDADEETPIKGIDTGSKSSYVA